MRVTGQTVLATVALGLVLDLARVLLTGKGQSAVVPALLGEDLPLQSSEVCESVGLFTDHSMTDKRRGTPRPTISIIYITKRPGGYDFLLNSLANQDMPNAAAHYELICVDEIASFRAEGVRAMAELLGVNLVGIVPSKPKSRAFAHTKFNIYNAINTGVLLARGKFVTFLMDFAWLPSSYLRRTLEFYSMDEHQKSFLAYPEHFFHIDKSYLPPLGAVNDPTRLSIFDTPVSKPLMQLLRSKGEGVFGLGYTRPPELVRDFYQGTPKGFLQQPLSGQGDFWELSFASLPFSCLERLNGAEEEFDVGDDCHEVNIRMRCKTLGYDLWIDGGTVVECMWHKNEIDTETALWNRYQKDSVQNLVLGEEMRAIRAGKRGVESRGHDFDLAAWRAADCAATL